MIRTASRPNDSTTQPVYIVGLYFNSSMSDIYCYMNVSMNNSGSLRVQCQ